jgi:hypothetical protein
MKTYGEMEALDRGEWSASRLARFTPRERALGTHWLEGWVDHRAGLDDVEKRKFLTLPGLDLRPLGRPYRLRYPGSNVYRSKKYLNRILHTALAKVIHSLFSPGAPYLIEVAVCSKIVTFDSGISLCCSQHINPGARYSCSREHIICQHSSLADLAADCSSYGCADRRCGILPLPSTSQRTATCR